MYPIEQWLAKGAVILEPNYRGSAGYGEKFRSLNVRNLGVGDAWDVLSGVDHLIAQGIADKDRMGVMGWSQGGYISAFLATHERQPFKAISVGAGISDWMTYYVNTDIHPFTRQYLEGDAVGRPGDLREDVADHRHQAREDADADSARRARCAGADPERLRALSGAAGRRRAGEADRLQGIRPRPEQAESSTGGDGTQPRMVREIRVGRGDADDKRRAPLAVWNSSSSLDRPDPPRGPSIEPGEYCRLIPFWRTFQPSDPRAATRAVHSRFCKRLRPERGD